MRAKIGTIGEVDAKLTELKQQGDYLIGTLEVPGAVPWNLVVTLDRKETTQIARQVLKPSILFFLLFGFASRQQPRAPKFSSKKEESTD